MHVFCRYRYPYQRAERTGWGVSVEGGLLNLGLQVVSVAEDRPVVGGS